MERVIYTNKIQFILNKHINKSFHFYASESTIDP